MRKSFHTLSGIFTDAMGQDPYNGNVYIFINRARDCIKLLHWEPGGMVLYSKLLEAGTLGKPDSANDNEVCTNIEWRELVMIVEGIMEACYLHIPADTRSAFPVISVQSPVSIQCCWQS